MGLFDIFRRKKKSAATSSASEAASQAQSAVTSDAKSAADTSASQAAESAVNQSQAIASSATSDEFVASASANESTSAVASAVSAASSKTVVSESESQEEVSDEETAASDVDAEKASSANSSNGETTAASTEDVSATAASDSTAVSEATSSATSADTSNVVATSEASDQSESEEERYDRGLEKSRTGFGARLNRFLANFRHVDEDFFDDLEDLMIESDVGYDMAMKLSDSLQEEVKLQNAKSKQEVSNVIIEKMVSLYEEAGNGENNQINFAKNGPTVIMFVGVNGAGKTTTIGKLAARYKREGKKVLLAAADTFRAGAVEQLDVWAKRDGVDIVTGPANGDPAAVVFDGVKKTKDEDYDVLLVDTAGRLQNKVNLMQELAKMKRVLSREIPEAPHEVLLVLDATTGQNALNQAKLFKESTDVTGIVLTKLDGTARGGIVLAIRNELHLPVKLVGLGEHVDDLADFDAGEFVYGLFKGLVNE